MSEIITQPVVSVCMITYNHEPYIAEAIEGVLMQKTDFPIELVIGEDCSTDRTREICTEYRRKYPDLIRLIANEQNMGMMPNFVQTLQACEGKYIAMCEGDDYWTDPLKLQKQVDFLDANQDFIIHYHHCNTLKDDKIINDDSKRNTDFQFNFINSVYGKNGYTLSMMFNQTDIVWSNFIRNINISWVGDWQLELFLLSNGKKGYFSRDTMGVYRSHTDGVILSHFMKLNNNEHLLHRYNILNNYIDCITNIHFMHHLRFRLFYLSMKLGLYSDITTSKRFAIRSIKLFFSNFSFIIFEKKISTKYLLQSAYHITKRQLVEIYKNTIYVSHRRNRPGT